MELIKKKIEEVANYFGEKWNESIREPLRFMQAYEKINSWQKEVELTDKTFEVSGLLKYATIPINDFTVEGMKLQSPSWYKGNMYQLVNFLHVKAEYNYRGIWKTARIYANLPNDFSRGRKCVLTDELRGTVKEYIKEQVGTSIVFVGMSHPKDLGWYRRNILGSVPKAQWREAIIEWQGIQKQILEDFCLDYRGIEQKKEYLEWAEKYKQWRKENKDKVASNYKTLDKKDGEVTIAYGRPPELGNNYVFEKNTYKLSNIPKTPHLVIAFPPSEIETARGLAALVKKEKVAIIGIRERQKITATQFIDYKKYMSDNKPFRRIATSILIHSVLNKYNKVVGRNSEVVSKCLENIENDVKELTTYKNNIYTGSNNEISQAISNLAKDMNLYDEEIMPVVKRVEKALETLAFLQYIETPRYWDEERVKEVKRFINQMLLFRKKYYNELEDFDIIYTPKQEEEPAF